MHRLVSGTVVIVTLLITSMAFGQQYDSRLLAKYSKKQLKEMANNNAPQLEQLNRFVSQGFQVIDIPAGKEGGQMPSVRLRSIDPKDINLLSLGVDQHEFARTYYRIEGTDKVLMILPVKELQEVTGNQR